MFPLLIHLEDTKAVECFSAYSSVLMDLIIDLMLWKRILQPCIWFGCPSEHPHLTYNQDSSCLLSLPIQLQWGGGTLYGLSEHAHWTIVMKKIGNYSKLWVSSNFLNPGIHCSNCINNASIVIGLRMDGELNHMKSYVKKIKKQYV